MQRRELYVGFGVLILAAAFALPAFVQGRFSGLGGRDVEGGWMMGGPRLSQNPTPVTSIDAAAERVRETLALYGGDDLVVAEVMEFSNHFYVVVKEKISGFGALELIVERNGFVHPEPGPNMMWNTKSGYMAGGWRMMGGGMMGRRYGHGPGYGYGPGPRGGAPAPSAQPITEDRAKQIAAENLAQVFPGTAVEEGVAFYGYFTFDVERGGKPVGMLSVNANTGAVWYHNWHGTFVAEKAF